MDDLDLGATIKGFRPGQKIFGRYTLKVQLGRGGMGVVWRARDESLERDVAIKMLPEVVANDPSAVRDLKRETAKSQQLSHPHILRIFDLVEAGPLCGITMELVEGGTLTSKRLEQPGEVFSVAALQKWVGQLCEALEYAHNREKIVHRDLKPANLMLTADGQLKVADFGIAASVSDSVSRVSQHAGSSGTPVYMSPQQMMGEKPAVSDDIYALGATLYELLTGKPPFYSGNIIMQVQHKVPPPMAKRRTELGLPAIGSATAGVAGDVIPPEWEATIAACLAKEPQDRPKSAGEVMERLDCTSQNPSAMSKSMAGTKHTKPEAKVERPTPEPIAAQAAEGSGTGRSASRTPLFAGIFAGVVLLGSLGWWLGVHAPEQRRLEAERLRLEQARIESERQRIAAEAARLAAARGGLIVRTVPAGAEVAVGGVGVERSPATFRELRLGSYEVTVTKAGYEPQSLQLTVEENRFTQPQGIVLAPTAGAVDIGSAPAGLDYVLRSTQLVAAELPAIRRTGKTPDTLTGLPTGGYEIVFRREGWPEQMRTLEVRSNEKSRVAADFIPGTLELTSTPSGAEVWSGGRKLGQTPYRAAEMPPGEYGFELKLPAHRASTVAMAVFPGQTTREKVTLDAYGGPVKDQRYTIMDLDLDILPIAPGTFLMGGNRRVTISDPYWLGKTEVTQRQWLAIMGTNPSTKRGENHPVENVSWSDAMEFCRKLSERERAAGRLPAGYAYTLPTEAQWEYACRAGMTGDFATNLDAIAWYDRNSGGTTKPVGTKQPNAWGLHDMLGNAMEWCYDWHGDNPGGSVDPTGPSAGSEHVIRGGNAFCSPEYVGYSYRKPHSQANWTTHGFRLALTISR